MRPIWLKREQDSQLEKLDVVQEYLSGIKGKKIAIVLAKFGLGKEGKQARRNALETLSG